MDDEDCYFCSRALDSGSVHWSHWSLFIVCGLSVVPNWLNITSSKRWRQCGSILPTNSRASQWLLHRLLFLLQRRIFVSEILEIEGHHWSNVKSSLMSNPILEVQPLGLSKNWLQTKNWLLKSTGASKDLIWSKSKLSELD